MRYRVWGGVFYGLNNEKNQYAPNQTAKITRAITQDVVRSRVSAMIGLLPDCVLPWADSGAMYTEWLRFLPANLPQVHTSSAHAEPFGAPATLRSAIEALLPPNEIWEAGWAGRRKPRHKVDGEQILEKRIGRSLTDAAVNNPDANCYNSERLLEWLRAN